MEEATYVVDILRVNEDLLAKIRDRLSNSRPPTLPPETRTNEKRCIFRLPKRLKKINGKSIEPQVVALGPYHHGKPRLQMMEELKWRWLSYLMESRNGKLEECLIELGPLEKEVRECYSESETNKFSSHELLQMMLVDGYFILMFFIRTLSIAEMDYRDLLPELEKVLELDEAKMVLNDVGIFRLDRAILPKIYGDLLLLENQIPSCVLNTVYKIFSDISPFVHSLSDMAMTFLCSIWDIPKSRNIPNWLGLLHLHNRTPKFRNMPDHSLEWLHLLDLVRLILISRCSTKESSEISRTRIRPFNPIPCVTKLRRAGIKVNRHTADTFLDVKFKNGVIKMPDIILDDSMCSLLVNCVAFEQSCNISKYFSNYAMLLDCLVNTARDVDYLCDHRVIDNYFGTDAEAAQFINNLDVNEYYRKRLNWGNWQWMSFKREYFGKPWLLISALVGFVLLVLTFLQTYYTIYAYVHPKN
ncbi:UPF0481 protein At3g47200-like [Corylus avellana]|uniref:UPF0481 protein At3g47200-like n=1 Tax=Corylus avellana TaxID=13451 RepID=UPI00286B11A5|nr:UPF0481 protein At3g47200-like [Corylus avellana]